MEIQICKIWWGLCYFWVKLCMSCCWFHLADEIGLKWQLLWASLPWPLFCYWPTLLFLGGRIGLSLVDLENWDCLLSSGHEVCWSWSQHIPGDDPEGFHQPEGLQSAWFHVLLALSWVQCLTASESGKNFNWSSGIMMWMSFNVFMKFIYKTLIKQWSLLKLIPAETQSHRLKESPHWRQSTEEPHQTSRPAHPLHSWWFHPLLPSSSMRKSWRRHFSSLVPHRIFHVNLIQPSLTVRTRS